MSDTPVSGASTSGEEVPHVLPSADTEPNSDTEGIYLPTDSITILLVQSRSYWCVPVLLVRVKNPTNENGNNFWKSSVFRFIKCVDRDKKKQYTCTCIYNCEKARYLRATILTSIQLVGFSCLSIKTPFILELEITR